MKRPIILGIVFLFAASFAGASTRVPDTLSGNVDWDSSQSPYIIQGKVEIPQGSVLHIGPGVHVVYQGVGELLIDGVLEVAGSASSPVVFDMTQAGLQSQFVLSGARADIANARFLGGIFLARDSQVDVRESEFTKGSGIYLQGKTQAILRSNKVYGNATGAVLDGGAIKATFVFNTFVQNTYGLYLKNYLYLKFQDNSIHDNNTEVINATHGTAQLGGNYWGTMDLNAIELKTQGAVNYPPLKSLKDVLRLYIMTQLPEITVAQSERLAAKERRDEKAEALALKKFHKEQEREAKAAAESAASASIASSSTVAPPPQTAPAASAPPPPVLPTLAQPPAAPAPTAVETPEESSASVETAPPSSGVAEVKPLPPAPYSLTPVPNLPPEQDLNLEGAASNPPNPETESAPEATAPAPPEVGENSTLTAPPPPPVPAAGDNNSVPPPPPASTAAPVASDDHSIPPPPPGMDTGASSIPPAPPPPAAGSIPAPPAPPSDDNSANGMSAVPPLPPAADSGATSPSTPVPAPTTIPAGRVSATGTSGDGLTAPSADLSQMALPPGSSPSTSNHQAPVTSVPDLALPPIEDLDVPPPKDLDLPPAGDLGNLDLDSKK